jgi:simple sugar transport system substrate-binding protein
MKKGITIIVLLAVLLMGMFAGCSSKTSQNQPASTNQPTSAKKYHFYVVSHAGASDPFWVVVIKAVNDAAKMYGDDVTYVAPAKYSLQEMINDVNSAVAAKPDGLVVTVPDPEGLDSILRSAISQGIPVICIDTEDPRPAPQKIPYLLYIGANEYISGRKLAEYVLSKFTPKRVVIADHEITNSSLRQRISGIQDVFKEHGLPLPEVINITDNPSQGDSILKAYIGAHPGTDLIMTLGPLGTIPAVGVVKELNLTGKVTVTGFDLTEQILDWIKNGEVLCTVDTQQYLEGYLAIELLHFYKEHNLIVPNDILTGPLIVDKSNVQGVEQSIKDGFR